MFDYIDGVMCAERVDLNRLADSVETPAYVYSAGSVLDAYRSFSAAFQGQPATICYAMKANDSLAIMRLLSAEGAGADVVSEGELHLALAAGVPADRIVFSGVGKTRDEMANALDAGIMQLNVESDVELAALNEVATSKGGQAPVALRINPDVEAGTLDQISTGRKKDKFGIAYELAGGLYAQAAQMPGIEPVGVAVHIGSQLTDLEPYRAAFARVRTLYEALRADGITVRRFDVGGGLGIDYQGEVPPMIGEYAAIVRDATAGLDCEIILEPGRRIVGRAGVLLTRVIAVKQTPERTFAIVDAAMNDLIRPMLYGAWHPIRPALEPRPNDATLPVDIVGPICESTDIFASQRDMPPLKTGDVLVIEAAGAYSSVMASEYNGRLRAPEVLVQGDEWAIVRARPTFKEMIEAQAIPDWLQDR